MFVRVFAENSFCTRSCDSVSIIQENYEIMRDFIILRASLVPYIYSNARTAYDEGISLLRPMYYDFPEKDNAYTYDKQVLF